MSLRRHFEKSRILGIFEELFCKDIMVTRGNFYIKNYTNISPFETYKSIFQSRSTTREIPRKMSIVSDCISIREKEPNLNKLFLDKNIKDQDEIYMTDIYRLPLTTGLSFIGYNDFGKFLPIFKILHFFRFSQQKMPP